MLGVDETVCYAGDEFCQLLYADDLRELAHVVRRSLS